MLKNRDGRKHKFRSRRLQKINLKYLALNIFIAKSFIFLKLFNKLIIKMKEDVLHISDLKIYFESLSSFTKDEILAFYEQFQPSINATSIKSRMHRLSQKGIIKRLGKNNYQLGEAHQFIPEIDSKTVSLYKSLSKEFPFLRFCIWNTSLFNEFMIHQPNIFYTIIETETDKDQRLMYAQSVFNFLKTKSRSVFLAPSKEVLDLYASESRNSLIVRPMVSESPLQKIEKVAVPCLEKILVDVFCEPNLFVAQQGSERSTIFKEAFQKYTINQTTLLRYASRRNQKEEIATYLKSLNLML